MRRDLSRAKKYYIPSSPLYEFIPPFTQTERERDKCAPFRLIFCRTFFQHTHTHTHTSETDTTIQPRSRRRVEGGRYDDDGLVRASHFGHFSSSPKMVDVRRLVSHLQTSSFHSLPTPPLATPFQPPLYIRGAPLNRKWHPERERESSKSGGSNRKKRAGGTLLLPPRSLMPVSH